MPSQFPAPDDHPQSSASPSEATADAESPASPEPFPIVAIGASAGGLEAYTQLLRELPNDTGMAFVLVQHLDPGRPSELPAILARAVALPVQEAADGMVVEPNQIYVIPSNAQMTIADGQLQLQPRAADYGSRRLVDTFFRALANERGNKAIGVILSGGDTDGTRGLEAIQGAGGVTFAQAQASAQVDNMPRSAIATGQVDFVQTPAEIAQTLIEISRHPYIVAPQSDQVIEAAADDKQEFDTILRLLKRQTKVDFTKYKTATLERRIARRMALYYLEELAAYRQYLQEHPQELEELYQEILIGVTSFFRDAGAFETLQQEVFPALLRHRSEDTPLRIWVAGCSTGEETYSMAMSLLEYLDRQPIAPPIQLFGTDLNEAAIGKARLGWYSPSQIDGVSPERLQRYFVQVQGGYQIKKTVRELCIFSRQNIIADPPFSQLDLISCRNLLIYLNAAAQRKVMPLLHYGLKPNGFLLLGSSETVGEFSNLFHLLDSKHKLYRKQPGTPHVDFNLLELDDSTDGPASPETPPSPAPRPPALRPTIDPYARADQVVLSHYGPVGVLVNTDFEILQFRGQTSAYLEPAPGRASLKLLSMTKAPLQLDVRTALYQAQQSGERVQRLAVDPEAADRARQVCIEVLPFTVETAEQPYYLVLFGDVPPAPQTQREPDLATAAPDGAIAETESIAQYQQENAQLRDDLEATRAHLQSIIQAQEATNQDLRAANEEVMSSNEELQSTNEELQTAKEEIQATNEELGTINAELYHRNAETARISDDFQNLLSSIHIPVLMLKEDLCIRRFTPTAAELFNLISSDVGRPLSNIHHRLQIDDLSARIRQVIDSLNQMTLEVQDEDGRWYEMRIRPYRTLDNRIDGAVVVLIDIERLKHNAAELQQSRDYSDAIVQTMREPLLVLNADLQVVTANRQFYRLFQVSPDSTEQQSVFELGNGQWDIPQLRELLHNMLPQCQVIEDFVVEHNFETIGLQTMRLNARQMDNTHGEARILLAIEPVSLQEASQS
jgi:two-component system CheB/CheR fusion protein